MQRIPNTDTSPSSMIPSVCGIDQRILSVEEVNVDSDYASSSVDSLYSRFPAQVCRTFFGAGGNRRACGVIERAWINYAIVSLEESIIAERAEHEDISYVKPRFRFWVRINYRAFWNID